MFNEKVIEEELLSEEMIDELYIKLLESKNKFIFLKTTKSKFVLTKERSFFEVDDLQKFLRRQADCKYYRTILRDRETYVGPGQTCLIYRASREI